MTTEEKAKAYDEALERAKKELKTCGSLDCDAARQIFRFFPELRESEDERIRLISLVKNCYENGGYALSLDEYKSLTAWLEKLKEQKHPDGCFTCDEYKKGYEEGRRNGFTAGYNKAIKEVEQKEQKPAEWNANDKAFIKDCARILDENGYAASAERLLSMFPVKPAEWSEEDKHNLNSVINLVHATTDGAWGSVIGVQIENWLKSLPERFNIQPKLEWSEEDELMLTAVIQTLERFDGRGTTGMQIDWLKSLRPSWKPSEEQMDSLRDTIVQTKGFSYSMFLPELYEDLKKLM